MPALRHHYLRIFDPLHIKLQHQLLDDTKHLQQKHPPQPLQFSLRGAQDCKIKISRRSKHVPNKNQKLSTPVTTLYIHCSYAPMLLLAYPNNNTIIYSIDTTINLIPPPLLPAQPRSFCHCISPPRTIIFTQIEFSQTRKRLNCDVTDIKLAWYRLL